MLPLPLVLAAALASADPGAPAEYLEEARLLFQVVGCRGGALPGNLDEKTVAAYCKRMTPKLDRFRERWGQSAQKFLVALAPASLPGELVYPFGGGDLMMALTAFPQVGVITTLSLELAGDPRRLSTLKDNKALEASLAGIEVAVTTTLLSNDSKSVNLSKVQQGELPGQLSMHLIGLALHDYEPVSVRFFRVEADGSLHYFTRSEVAALEGQTASKLKESWRSPDFSPAFANVEVQFVPRGQPGAPRRTHRHLGADLSNEGLKQAPGVLKHLEAKGQVAAMTKAASYLLWNEAFSTIRDYLTGHLEFMLSDSTGVPVSWCKKAGLTVETYGEFEKTFLGRGGEELRALYAAQPSRKLPMRFGYPDGSPKKSAHLLVTRRPQPKRAADAGR
ncbi:MAG: hypothetical protein ACYC8T_20675 [Myxococcaceae bacterium]